MEKKIILSEQWWPHLYTLVRLPRWCGHLYSVHHFHFKLNFARSLQTAVDDLSRNTYSSIRRRGEGEGMGVRAL
jgi:hypothetical protein